MINMRNKLVSIAKEWVGTPYQHQQGLKGVGVDCAYLMARIAEEAGLVEKLHIEPYSVEWHIHNRDEEMLRIIEGFGCTRKNSMDAKIGDILCFQYGRVCSHLGMFVGPNTFIHANLSVGKVILSSLNGEYHERWKYTYNIKGMENE
jgi:cell wall-associated NlpC family hydrolase